MGSSHPPGPPSLRPATMNIVTPARNRPRLRRSSRSKSHNLASSVSSRPSLIIASMVAPKSKDSFHWFRFGDCDRPQCQLNADNTGVEKEMKQILGDKGLPARHSDGAHDTIVDITMSVGYPAAPHIWFTDYNATARLEHSDHFLDHRGGIRDMGQDPVCTNCIKRLRSHSQIICRRSNEAQIRLGFVMTMRASASMASLISNPTTLPA